MYDINPPTKYPYTHVNSHNGKMQRMGFQRRTICYMAVFILGTIFLYTHFFGACSDDNKARMYPKETLHYVYDEENKSFPYDRQMPLIFIGGVPRSGTTLMRAMLDAHPDVRCGEETRVIPRILGMRGQWAKSAKEARRLQEAGLSDDVIDDALSAFILEVIAKHGEPARRLCNKDPFTLKSSVYLAHLFPNSKFILMIRDGRAVVHSIITRKVTISGFDLKSFPACLKKWNAAMESMYYQCLKVGPARCMPVYYEQLVLHPELWMKHILDFLDIDWDLAVLHHEEFINKPGGISLSKTERSTDQVVKPINMEALTAWVDHVPADIRTSMGQLAPMLDRLGYDPLQFPPNYGAPDKQILDNTLDVKQNADQWRKRGKDLSAQPKYYNRYKNNLDGGGGGVNGKSVKSDTVFNGQNTQQKYSSSQQKLKIQANSDNQNIDYIETDDRKNKPVMGDFENGQNSPPSEENSYRYKYVYNKPEDDIHLYANKAS